jgi:glyoxylase-like metal-dependent hydrolase (beta-lactamase superfamily II)
LKTAALLVAFALCSSAVAEAELPPERLYKTVDIADGIFAFVSPETSGPIPSGNVVAIVGGDGVLLVDSGRFPALATRMIADVRKRTDKPVRWLVHTHWHADHIAADSTFQAAFPQMTFVSTDFTRRKMLEKQAAYLRDVAKNDAGYVAQLKEVLEKEKALPAENRRYLEQEVADLELEARELDGARLVPPGLTFADSLTVHLGGREVRVAFLGKGNTEGDTVVSVPDARVVVTGDLLVAPVPYGYGCHPKEWIATLQRLMTENADAAAIVPGHGPVMHDWDYARRVTAVLESIRAQVAEAVRDGASLDDTRKRIHLEPFQKQFAGDDFGRGKAFRDFFVSSAVERAYQEATGRMAEE